MIFIAALLFAYAKGTTAAHACGAMTYAKNGTVYRILFARNGAVQQYVLLRRTGNTERDHDVLLQLERRYGPEGVNAPPLSIVSFRQGSGGMMIPEKAVDSCGRTIILK